MGKLASIVMVTCNRLEFARQSIRSILENTHYPDYELIILDNGSHDGTAEYLKEIKDHPRITQLVFFQKNQGKGRAANTGFAMSQGEYIIGLDDDVIVPVDWLKTVTKAIERIPNLGWLSLNLRPEQWGSFSSQGSGNVFRKEYEHRFGDIVVQAVPAVAGFCVAMSRSTYNKLGGYIETSYYGGVDGEYNQRAKQHHLLTGYLMNVVAEHLGGTEKEKKLYPDYQKYKYATQRKLKEHNTSLAKKDFFKENKDVEGDQNLRIIRGEKPAVYILQQGKKHLIPNTRTFIKLGLSWRDVENLSQKEIDEIPNGPAIPEA